MENIIHTIYDIVWSPVLVIFLVGAGLYFTIRTRCVQVRHLGTMFRILFAKQDQADSGEKQTLSSFEALCVTLSGSVGVGNIVGVATAIALGGPGAVFWMWIIAFFGASTSFMECSLAQMFKFRHNGGWRGGPFCYVEGGLGKRWLAVVLAVLMIISYGLTVSMIQVNNLASAFSNSFSVPPLITGLVIIFLLLLILVGGAKRIAQVASVITPFMAGGYILMSLIILVFYWRDVPGVFAQIFSCAFGFDSALGGMVGSAVVMGVKRGLFSNEAGEGGGAIASASAEVKYPVQQGFVQAFAIFFDTLIVCTATALMILVTGMYNVFDSNGVAVVENVPELGSDYVSFSQAAIDTVFDGFGGSFVSIALSFFAFSTVMAVYFYSESCIIYILRERYSVLKERVWTWIYRIFLFASIIFGAVKNADTVWTIGDIGLGLTTWVNVAVLFLLCPKVIKSLKEYERLPKEHK